MEHTPDWEEAARKIRALSEKQKRAILWLIYNFSTAEKLCEAEPLTEEQRNAYAARAKADDDQILRLLLELEKIIHKAD